MLPLPQDSADAEALSTPETGVAKINRVMVRPWKVGWRFQEGHTTQCGQCCWDFVLLVGWDFTEHRVTLGK